MSSPAKNRILSGVQPTGNLHLGNYLGAIRNWVNLQSQYECYFMLADLHAITVPQEPDSLRKAVREVAAAYIACGIDPDKCAIFPQSSVSGHSELSWILSCETPLGWLNRMTQFKEKIQATTTFEQTDKELSEIFKAINKFTQQNIVADQLSESIHHPTGAINRFKIVLNEFKDLIKRMGEAKLGLYGYPVLMAADILLYKATHVPVGEDQKQHLELARDIAGAFNRHYGSEFFPLPEPVILKNAARIMSLRDGMKKMSKSDESDYSRINLTDDADTIALKFRKAKSDMVEGLSYNDDSRPEAKNLLSIYAAIAGITVEAAMSECDGLSFSAFKQKLTDAAVAHLSPITSKMRELMANPDHLDSILKRGIAKARAISDDTMGDVKNTVGFLSL